MRACNAPINESETIKESTKWPKDENNNKWFLVSKHTFSPQKCEGMKRSHKLLTNYGRVKLVFNFIIQMINGSLCDGSYTYSIHWRCEKWRKKKPGENNIYAYIYIVNAIRIECQNRINYASKWGYNLWTNIIILLYHSQVQIIMYANFVDVSDSFWSIQTWSRADTQQQRQRQQ